MKNCNDCVFHHLKNNSDCYPCDSVNNNRRIFITTIVEGIHRIIMGGFQAVSDATNEIRDFLSPSDQTLCIVVWDEDKEAYVMIKR